MTKLTSIIYLKLTIWPGAGECQLSVKFIKLYCGKLILCRTQPLGKILLK